MIRILLLSVMCVAVLSQPVAENQRLFTMAVARVRHLHLVANDLFNEFENSLQVEDQRHLSKIFLQDSCHSDYFMSPIDKHETQRSSVLKLLSISYRLVESWEISSSFLVAGFVVKTQVTSKLNELKTGLLKLIEAYQDGEGSSEGLVLQLAPYRFSYQSAEVDDSFKRNYELFACFKKDMHKVETYLAVAKCRLSPETNCTL